ncbi:hypothetical protein TSUD_83530 [Trifolium subterraneum]|uniref:PGG domain-containing protein n=1 Tax=Trifolium subterraneum TaxID=3900 RepID=A0A2Z6NTB3_TRISU|nr:hypothetical protein TSUD_83530 [Trifolium subterraneum]
MLIYLNFLVQFFSSNGFPCPSLQSPSDHFVNKINKDFEQRKRCNSLMLTIRKPKCKDPEKGLGTGGLSTEEAIDILVKSYDSSEISHQVQKELSQIKKRARGSLLVFVVTFVTFITVGGFPSFVEDMKSFEKLKPMVAAINCSQENLRSNKVT